jgi:hypothetical protein
MAKYDDGQLVAILQQAIAQSNGGVTGNTTLQQNRQAAVDYYLSRAPIPTGIPGRSSVISTDVRDSIQSVLAAMVPAFSTNFPCQFLPERSGDEQQAEIETKAVLKIMEESGAYSALYNALHDSLLCKNGYIKCWSEEYEYSTTARFKGGDAQDNAALLAMAGEGAEIESEDDSGVVLRTSTERKRLRIVSVAPERLYIDANLRSTQLQDASFIAEWKPITRSDLLEADYPKDVVEGLAASGYAPQDNNSFMRNMAQQSNPWTAPTPDQDLIAVWECYIKIAMTGDESELWRIIMAEPGVILDKERVEYLPYACGAILMMPHRHDGISLFDLVKESQDVGTATLRQWIDNNQSAVLNRLVLSPAVNADDVENGGPNHHIRMTRGDDVSMAVMPLPFADIGGSCEQLLAYKDRMRSQRAGASLDLQGAENQQMTAQIGSMGADRIISNQEQVAGLFTRNFSETLIRSAFLLVHQCLRLDYDQPMQLKQGEQWLDVNPGDWLERSQVQVTTGMTPGERNRRIGALTGQLQVATQALQSGLSGILVDPSGLYRILMDLSKAQDLTGAPEYWIDPASPKAQQAAQQQAQQHQQMQQMQMQMNTLKDQVSAQKNQIDAANDAAELQFKYAQLAAQMEMKESEIVGSATLQLQQMELAATQKANGSAQNMGRTEAA